MNGGKSLYYPKFYDIVDGGNGSAYQSTDWSLDASNLPYLTIHYAWSGIGTTSRYVCLYGTNLEAMEHAVLLPGSSHIGDGSFSAGVFWTNSQEYGSAIVTYKEMPKFVRPLFTSALPSTGTMSVNLFGWIA